MLKDELDEMVRNIRLSKPKNPKISPEEEQARKKMMEERIEKDANYVWQALRKRIIHKSRKDQPVTIFMGICDNPNDPGDTGHVYFMYNYFRACRRLVFRKVRYPKETRIAISNIAMEEGIGYQYIDYTPKIDITLVYRSAGWCSFHYSPPEE